MEVQGVGEVQVQVQVVQTGEEGVLTVAGGTTLPPVPWQVLPPPPQGRRAPAGLSSAFCVWPHSVYCVTSCFQNPIWYIFGSFYYWPLFLADRTVVS